MEESSCRCGVVLDKFWLCNGGVSEVLLFGGTWRLFGARSQGLFPFFPSLSLPSKLPSCSLPFHSLSFFLFPPCQSPTLKTLSCQFFPPNIVSIPLFYRPSSPFLPSPFNSSSLTQSSFFLFSNVSYVILIIIFLFYLPSLPLSSLLCLSFFPPSYFLLLHNPLHSPSFIFPSPHHLFSGALFLHPFRQCLL